MKKCGGTHICGGLGIQVKDKKRYFELNKLESVHEWKGRWIYVIDQPQEGQLYGLPPYSKGVAMKRRSWAHHLSKDKEMEADVWWEKIL